MLQLHRFRAQDTMTTSAALVFGCDARVWSQSINQTISADRAKMCVCVDKAVVKSFDKVSSCQVELRRTTKGSIASECGPNGGD